MSKEKKIMKNTRQRAVCPIFGSLKELNERVLPTVSDMLKYYLFVKFEMKMTVPVREPTVAEISEVVAQKIESIWANASIPHISHKSTTEKIRKCYDKYRNILKPFKGRRSDKKYQQKMENYRNETTSCLFDIALCKCKNFDICKCEKTMKIPLAERLFIQDQRFERKMVIGGVDVSATKQKEKREKRKQVLNERIKRKMFKNDADFQDHAKSLVTLHQDSKVDKYENIELIQQPSTSSSSYMDMEDVVTMQYPTQNRLSFPTFSMECDRFGISDRAAASIASAVLQDIGILNERDTTNIVDRNKIRRQREKFRNTVAESTNLTMSQSVLTGLYFDGRKDNTKVQIMKGTKYYPKTVKEEHYTLVKEPNSVYIGHVTVPTGEAKSIKEAILNFFVSNNIKLHELTVIGCDGTNVNTGHRGGVIRSMELELNRPLQWCICLLHTNELPLQHLLSSLDGATTGPTAFCGPIGKAIKTCEELPVDSFSSIAVENMPDNIDRMILSNDQQYLYDICIAISRGACESDLELKKPGPVAHSRWLTTAGRILRLYVATEQPSDNLIILATYIMKVYAPVWFHIKTKPSITEGARHIWRLISFSRYLDPNVRKLVDNVVQRNGFFCHPENLLLSMLTDTREHIRSLALRKLICAREENRGSTEVRIFQVPKINFNAKDYFELITWQRVGRFEPPILINVPCEDIETMVKVGKTEEWSKYPCHTQAVERCIRLVSEASESVCGQEKRHGFILNMIKSRKHNKHFNTKKDYNL